jgi:broad specificity phosphatase PhoE
MPRKQSKKAEKYDDHQRRVARAIQELKDNPEAKLKNIAQANGLSRKM